MLEPLKTLRKILQDAADLESPGELLEHIVSRVQQSIAVEVCSIYLLDTESEELVLVSTRGLQGDAVGQVRLPLGDGIVGRIASKRSVINVADASGHPGYRYFPVTGEEKYHGILGAPIIHFRRLLGVIVVQRVRAEAFSDEDEAFLVTVAAQLSTTIKELQENGALEDLTDAESPVSQINLRRTGVKGAAGMAIGTLHWVSHSARLTDAGDDKSEDIEGERERFREALESANREFREGGERLGDSLPKDVVALFGVYRLILEDPELIREIEQLIEDGWVAESALRKTVEKHARVFEAMEDPYLQAKAEDIRHIGERVYAGLLGHASRPPVPSRGTLLLIGEEISIADVAQFPARRLGGLICTKGSTLSHLAILANALGIPAVMGIGEIKPAAVHGREAVLDGYRAQIIFNPVANLRQEYRKLARQEKRLVKDLGSLKDKAAETPDGYRVTLMANTGLLADISPGLMHGAEGVGLYRSEIPFMIHESFPSEDEQVAIYRNVLTSYAPMPVNMRTLDIGGDKPLPYYVFKEDNPFLGWRGIRFTLDNTSIFLSQIRAMLRASEGLSNLRILLPMVSQIEEVIAFKALLREAYDQLREEGLKVTMPPTGAMIEVPSVAYVMDQLAEHIEFVSIGSNDFTQYLMAVDRNNPKVSSLYDWLNPAVLRALQDLNKSASRKGLQVSLCGEMAADPAAVILLIGMGMKTLSLSAFSLPKTKWVIRTVPRKRCEQLLRKALKAPDARSNRQLLEKELDDWGLGGLIRAGDQ